MHWQTEQEKQALADFRARNRKIAVLQRELADFHEILSSPLFSGQRTWALQMVKSIEHELDELQS